MLEWVVMDVLRDIANTLEMCVCVHVCVCTCVCARVCVRVHVLSCTDYLLYKITFTGLLDQEGIQIPLLHKPVLVPS